jgi:hypothetical protein
MSYADRVAEQYPEWQGFKLIDYREVAIPALLINVTVSVLDKRPLDPVKEYVIRAIGAGLRKPRDIGGLLGIKAGLIERTIEELKADGYLYWPYEDSVALTERGNQIAKGLVEEVIREQEIPVLWDAIKECTAETRGELITHADAKERFLVLIPPRTRKPPEKGDLRVEQVQELYNRIGREERGYSQVLRILDVKKPRFRYAEMVGLLYASEDRQEFRLRLANDDHIDANLSDAFADSDGPSRLRLSDSLQGRLEENLLKQRLTHTARESDTQSSTKLRTERSLLKLRMSGLKRAQQEAPSQELEARISESTEKLSELDCVLQQWPVQSLLPYEIADRVIEAFNCAKERVVMTSTLPTPRRFDQDVKEALASALGRGVTVDIYVSDRIESSQVGAARRAVTELNEFANRAQNLHVRFLQDTSRRWFEILVDNDRLVVSNDPPLGDRRKPAQFRAFEGKAFSKIEDVASYIKSYLHPDKLPYVSSPIQRSRDRPGLGRGPRNSASTAKNRLRPK